MLFARIWQEAEAGIVTRAARDRAEESSSLPLGAPVVLILFNRPDTTGRVFEVVRSVRPRRLFVIADGPRPGRDSEAELCAASRAVAEMVDWPCEVRRNYSEINLGCARRVSSGLDWVFQQVEEAIILEDDCVPDPTFFRFCDELLKRYRDDQRVTCISGDNFQEGRCRTADSYYFSLFTHIWGWATWRRAWRHFDLDMRLWPGFREGGWLVDLLVDPAAVRYWEEIFDRTYRHEIDTWDYAWMFSCWVQSSLTVLPNVNLVANIGFDERATHTKRMAQSRSLATGEMTFPLRHPSFTIRDQTADGRTMQFILRDSGRLGTTTRMAGAGYGLLRRILCSRASRRPKETKTARGRSDTD